MRFFRHKTLSNLNSRACQRCDDSGSVVAGLAAPRRELLSGCHQVLGAAGEITLDHNVTKKLKFEEEEEGDKKEE